MWSAWFVVGLLLLITKRYAKKHWHLMHYLHAILGYFVLIVTIIFALKITKWDPFADVHSALGSITVIITIVGTLTGSFTAGTMRFYNGDKAWTKKERVEVVAKIHRYAGYFMLFLGNVTIMTGTGHYFNDKLNGDDRVVYAPLSLGTFIVLVIIFETIYRIRNNYSKG